MRSGMLRDVFITLLGLCVLAPGPPAVEAADLAGEMNALGQEVDRAIVAGDLETGLSFYADDAILLPNYGEKLAGKKAIRERMLADRAKGVRIQSFTGLVDHAWECGGMVYTVGTYAMSVGRPGTERPIGDRGKFITIWRRESSGQLRIVYDIWNTDIPAGK